MVTEVSKRLINVEEYYKMAEVGILKPSDRVELIHGEIIDMSPIGSRHASIVDKLAKILNQTFNNEVIIGIQRPIRLDRNNEPEPDISILKFKSDYYSDAHPKSKDTIAIIEVSDSSLKYDQEIKAPLYASSGIPCVWIINIEANHVEVYSDPGDSGYQHRIIHKIDDTIELLGKFIEVQEIITQPKAQ